MKNKPITVLLLSLSLFLGPLLADEAENDTAKLLREALFAEEADRDLAKAEKGYREIVKTFDADRAYAATAILRLAEILHKRGDTAEAEKWFARVLQEFPDQQAIAKVAKARLGDKAAALVGAIPIKADPQLDEVERLKKLLAQSPDLLDTPKDGTTPLATAAAKGQLDVIEFLLSKGVRINGGDGFRDHYPSALAAAVEKGHIVVIERLIKAGAKPENGILHRAVRSGNYAAAELLLKAGADPNTTDGFQRGHTSSIFERPEPTSRNRLQDDVNWTPLEIATYYRFTKLTDLLLANGAKPQESDGRYTEELRFAILDKNAEQVAELLRHGADPNSQWVEGQKRLSALVVATYWGGDTGIVKQLIEAGASVDAVEANSGKRPLHYAKGAAVELLLAAGADPNVGDNNGNTPLHSADDPTKAKALLAAGADVNAIGSNGYTPVAYADLSVLDILLAAGPDLARSGKYGTPLGIASGRTFRESQVDRIGKLIAAGADPNLSDKHGRTPLMIAISYLRDDSVKALIAGGADPNGIANSPTPLNSIPRYLNSPGGEKVYGPTIRALVDAGAYPNVIDKRNYTALMKAAANDELETCLYLLEKGAAPEVGGKFAFSEAPQDSATKTELFLATYLQTERRRGIVRTVSPKKGHVFQEVSAFVPAGEELPPCPHTLLEAYAFSEGGGVISAGEAKIWREGKAEPLNIDLRKIIASGDSEQDVALAWGDLVEFTLSNSPEEAAFGQTEKDFLDAHLKRTVKFTQDGEVNEVRLRLSWSKLANDERWFIGSPDHRRTNYKKSTTNLPLVALKSIGVEIPNLAYRHTPDRWIVERRDGQKLKFPSDQQATLWLEEGDTVAFEGHASVPPPLADPAEKPVIRDGAIVLPPNRK